MVSKKLKELPNNNRIDGLKIEKLIAKLLNGKIVKSQHYDIQAEGLVEVKSFYVFSKSGYGSIAINKKTHERYKTLLNNKNCRYIFVGKTRKHMYPIRLIFVMTWEEVDKLLEGRKVYKWSDGRKARYYRIPIRELFRFRNMRLIEE